jgi:hypothetical protein
LFPNQDFLERLEEDWTPGAWWRFGTSGFYGMVPYGYVVAILSFMRELLLDPNSTAVLRMDSRLEPVVLYHPHDGPVLRTSTDPLEED